MPLPLVIVPIPPVPSAMPLDDKGDIVSQPWQQWFVNLRDKVNVINAALVGISTLPTPPGAVNSYIFWNGTTFGSRPVLTGVIPGTYTNATITVQDDGRLTFADNGTGGAGGVLPVVTGEIAGGQPVFVYLDDGSLVFAEVA